MADVVRTAVAQTWQIEAEFVTSTPMAGGIRNAYPQPAKLGVDRWLAMIGAHALERGAVCIVSVGTAMTIDGIAADGRHLGGVIVPGPDLMVTSLLKNTSDIAQRARQGDASDGLFADNTLGAIRQGAEHALAALVERAVGVMRRTLNETPKLLVTGGASDRVEKAIGLPYRAVPDLVLQGLAVLAARAPPLRALMYHARTMCRELQALLITSRRCSARARRHRRRTCRPGAALRRASARSVTRPTTGKAKTRPRWRA